MNEHMNRFQLEVGDRVAVYSRYQRLIGVVKEVTVQGLICFAEDGFYSLHEDSPFHPKQCRKLVKRERREWWLLYTHPAEQAPKAIQSFDEADKTLKQHILFGQIHAFIVHVREVKK